MTNITEEISSYIKYLNYDCGLYVSLHPQTNENIIMESDLRIFNIHQNSYCVFIKGCNNLYDKCLECQKKAFEKVKNESFIGICCAGVTEYVYPINRVNECIGFISVSGFASKNASKYLLNIAQYTDISIDVFKEKYNNLNPLCAKEKVDTLIKPLQRMLELAYIKKPEIAKTNDFYSNVKAYLKKHHTEKITSEDICKKFFCSRSYLSHTFKSKSGMSIREYINRLRIEDAKNLLAFSNLNITEIATAVGFTDSNYFSKTFKKLTGTAPAKYGK